MDGTFLNSQSEITPEAIRVVDECEKLGVKFAICSGRTIPALEHFCKELGGRGYIIGANGGHIVKGDLSETILRTTLLMEDAKVVYNLSQIVDTNLIVWSGDRLFVSKDNEYTRFYAKISYHDMTLYDPNDPPFLKEALENGRAPIEKMFWLGAPETTDINVKYAPQFMPKTVNFTRSGDKFVEIVDASVNKANGLLTLANHLGISSSEIVCFGDADNDIPMLEAAGMSVCVANANDNVKKISKMITDTNDNGGVLKAFCKIFGVMI